MNLLTADLTKVDISRPLLAKGVMRFAVADVKMTKSKDNTKDMVEFTFKSEFPSESAPQADGSTVKLNPGYTIIDRVIITPSEKRTEEMILKDLARRRFELTGSQQGNFAPIEQYIGKKVEAIVDIEVDKTGEFGDQNRLRKMKPAA